MLMTAEPARESVRDTGAEETDSGPTTPSVANAAPDKASASAPNRNWRIRAGLKRDRISVFTRQALFFGERARSFRQTPAKFAGRVRVTKVTL